MRTLKLRHILNSERSPRSRAGAGGTSRASQVIEAEVLDISPRLCRLRIERNGFFLDRRDVLIQFGGTEVVARVIWTNTSENWIDVGLLLPASTETAVFVPELDES